VTIDFEKSTSALTLNSKPYFAAAANFLATRSINRYNDSPQELKKGAWPVRLGLHLVDTSSREISVRDERDSLPSAVWQEQPGLISKGEFGSTLGMILPIE
jgi:hypothetical protein